MLTAAVPAHGYMLCPYGTSKLAKRARNPSPYFSVVSVATNLQHVRMHVRLRYAGAPADGLSTGTPLAPAHASRHMGHVVLSAGAQEL